MSLWLMMSLDWVKHTHRHDSWGNCCCDITHDGRSNAKRCGVASHIQPFSDSTYYVDKRQVLWPYIIKYYNCSVNTVIQVFTPNYWTGIPDGCGHLWVWHTVTHRLLAQLWWQTTECGRRSPLCVWAYGLWQTCRPRPRPYRPRPKRIGVAKVHGRSRKKVKTI